MEPARDEAEAGSGDEITKRLQPARTAAFLSSELRYHGVAVRAAETAGRWANGDATLGQHHRDDKSQKPAIVSVDGS